MFLRHCWYVAAWAHELTPGMLHPITIANTPLVLYRTDKGQLVALEDRCCHRTAPLSKGRLEDGCNLRCMYHGFKFNTEGQCIAIPGETKIPGSARVATFPIIERHGWAWVWLGDKDKADPALIPTNVIGVGHPDFIMKPGNIDYAANYELINDNLTDFSHLSFVHAKSFGASEAWANVRPHIEQLPRGIRVTRWMRLEEAMSEEDGKDALRGGDTPTTALYETYDYLAPGILLMYSGYFPIEEMPADGHSPPKSEPLSVQFTSQAVTPMTDQTSRYFFTWGPRKSDEGAQELADQLMALGAMAFAEDRDIIEAQQRTLNLGAHRQLLTTADAGPMMMRRVLRELIAQHDP